jgi:hypothetical protein
MKKCVKFHIKFHFFAYGNDRKKKHTLGTVDIVAIFEILVFCFKQKLLSSENNAKELHSRPSKFLTFLNVNEKFRLVRLLKYNAQAR